MYPLDSAHVIHVAKTGNDVNAGHAQQYPVAFAADAKLTIAGAVAVAVNGDTIILWPGDYDESVDLDTANLALTIIGADRYSCKIVPTAGHGVTLESGSTLYNLSIEALGAGNVGIAATSKSDVTIQGCDIYGDLDGFNSTTPTGWLVRDSRIRGNADGLNFSVAVSCIYDNCVFETTGTYVTTDITNRAAIGSGQSIFNKCQFRGVRNDSTAYYLGGVAITGAGAISFNKCVLSVSAGANSEDAYGLKVTNSGALVSLSGCSFNSVSSSALAYDIDNSGGGLIVVSGCAYDPAKVRGRVTQMNTGYDAFTSQHNNAAVAFLRSEEFWRQQRLGGGGW